MFDNETPENIMDYEIDDILTLIEDPPGCNLPKPKVRLNYVKMLYDVFGYKLTPDVALASVSAARNQLIIAPAGGGKTTLEQIKAVQMKLTMPSRNGKGKINGDSILCLVYNTHNVQDMKDKHKDLVTRLKMHVKGADIDDHINAYTMHSFCEFWRKQYVAQLNLLGFTLLEDNQKPALMRQAISVALKLKCPDKKIEIPEKGVLAFYDLCKESLKEPCDLVNSDKFKDLGVSLEIVEECFLRYDRAKSIKKKYDYTDMLTKVYELLKSDDSVKKRVQKYYEYVIADEVQDFTPLMWEILKLLVDNGTPLTCIGDEDQLIYYFRGAEINELLHFSEEFPDGKVYTSTQNRRCKKEILDEARFAISENTLRFNKQINGIKDGGKVELIPYNSIDGQIINVVERIKMLDPDEQHKSVICFRENSCAQLLTDVLVENKVEYNSLQGVLPYSYELYQHVISVLQALEMPYERKYSISLYKVLPCKKSEIYQIFGFDAAHFKFVGEEKHKHFAEYDYGKSLTYNGFSEVMGRLIDISNGIDKLPLSSYIGEIIDLINKYFWNYKRSVNPSKVSETYDDIFEERIRKFFSSDLPFPEFSDIVSKTKNKCRRNNESHAGVTISTFHGLKGLEFEHVYVLFMDNSIFPNFSLIESRDYPKEIEQQLKESETRLWYVAITRAISDLHVYYSKSCPSRYVSRILDRDLDEPLPSVKEETMNVKEQTTDNTIVLNAFSDDDFDDFDNDEILGDEAVDNTVLEKNSDLSVPKSMLDASNDDKSDKGATSEKDDFLSKVLARFDI